MKATLLLLLSFFFVTAYSQAPYPIDAYMGSPIVNNDPIDGYSNRYYTIVNSALPLDHNPTGADVTWDFGQLATVGIRNYSNGQPTPEELSIYPNSTMATTITSIVSGTTTTGKTYSIALETFSFTGGTVEGLDLNFATDNALVGDFPMAFGYTNSDTVGGTYVYGIYSGTFTGTINSTVDAWGKLSTNTVDFGVATDTVSRLKTVQVLNLSYGIFQNAGTVTQTTHHYYRQGDQFPLFKSTTTHIVAALLEIDETITSHEMAYPALLGTENFNAQKIRVAPNPVSDRLSIQAGNENIHSVRITNSNGGLVLEKPYDGNPVDVGSLNSGIYYTEIYTDSGKVVKKIIKN